ncbi:hypothetical protein EDEG_02706 [Edhazardia aedis USNM 41457]|uniref:Uncharacterized protein n=1 Tax=Edhazardia aedis (strain USNM 41457) TaxID=1003232 RepID=J9DNB9_EDHAE|nr:hypothetical protein EDEG_02706 [Edhazardia aedis USNM 41457]|eukprot:EJW02882.1 hypothetical protein EDEG_02706 [Edhazardia aedis USNM 41457]
MLRFLIFLFVKKIQVSETNINLQICRSIAIKNESNCFFCKNDNCRRDIMLEFTTFVEKNLNDCFKEFDNCIHAIEEFIQDYFSLFKISSNPKSNYYNVHFHRKTKFLNNRKNQLLIHKKILSLENNIKKKLLFC